MRWAFWRAARSAGTATPVVAPTPVSEATATRSPVRPDDTDDQRPPTAAFSGASPDPGRHARTLPIEGVDDFRGLLSVASGDPSLDGAGVRADVVALVRAALTRDRAAAAEALRRLAARGPEEPTTASIAAMAALGDRCAAAAGVPASPLNRDRAAWAEVVAQGETVAARADSLLRAVAPEASRDRVRSVVHVACGVAEQDPAVAQLVSAPPEELVLVAAALLAQTVLDGGGDAQALVAELEQLLPQ